ncbi:MAG: hypothetical protein WCS70_02980 [Verrucomicrobiota bacterium]
MKRSLLIAVAVIALIAAGRLALAETAKTTAAAATGDLRLDKIITQNEEILKNQAEILRQIEDVKTTVGALKRRSS